MEKIGHNEDYYINISANSNTLKSGLILQKDYQVDFNHQTLFLRYSDLPALNIREDFTQYSQYKQYTR